MVQVINVFNKHWVLRWGGTQRAQTVIQQVKRQLDDKDEGDTQCPGKPCFFKQCK